MFRVFTTIIMCFTVLSGIYDNISLFHSYSEVNLATQSVSRSDGGSAPRDDLYSSQCQRRPCQLDELQRQIPYEDSIHAMLVSSGQNRTAPRLCLVAPKVFYSISITDGVLDPCCCCLWLAYLGTLG